MFGNNRSKAMNKTRRRFDINLVKKRFYIPEEDKWITLKVKASVLKTINKNGISAVLKRARETDHEKTNDSNLILLKQGKSLQVKAEKDSEFLFIAGKPIGEPIARGGPFVMNTKAEIIEAINDYQNGTFAKY